MMITRRNLINWKKTHLGTNSTKVGAIKTEVDQVMSNHKATKKIRSEKRKISCILRNQHSYVWLDEKHAIDRYGGMVRSNKHNYVEKSLYWNAT